MSHVAVQTDFRWGMVPEWLLETDVSTAAIRVFAALSCYYANRSTKSGFPARESLANTSKVSLRTLDKALRELTSVGAVSKTARRTEDGHQTSNLYTLHYANSARGGAENDTPGVQDPAPGSDSDQSAENDTLTSRRSYPTSSEPKQLQPPENSALHARMPSEEELAAFREMEGTWMGIGGTITQRQGEDLWDWIEDGVTKEVILAAMNEASDNGVRKWNYMKSCVERMKVEGIERRAPKTSGRTTSSGPDPYEQALDEAAKKLAEGRA